MRFAYQLFNAHTPSVPLRGRWARPRPIITTTVLGPANSCLVTGQLDTGADETIFPTSVAQQIGLDLSQAPSGATSGLGPGIMPLRYAEVILRLTDGVEFREWSSWVGFTPAPLKRALFGFGGFLQFFTAAFHGDREEIFLDVNALYRGT
jgi:hypothetical protein